MHSPLGSYKLTLIILATSLMSACATYQSHISTARSMMTQGESLKAAEFLEKEAAKEGRDQLVYLLDYATALYEAGSYKESIASFLRADKLVDFNDYVSLSKEASSLLLSENLVQYKGDSFEKILINVYLALNYLKLNQIDEASVEARRLNQRLIYLKEQGEKDYNRSVLARYLSAMIWEDLKQWDSAYIDYLKAFEADPSLTYLKSDLFRSARNAQRTDDLEKYRKMWPGVMLPQKMNSSHGQLVVLFERGWIPRKGPSQAFPRIPDYYPAYFRNYRAHVYMNSKSLGATEMLFDVGAMARENLNDQIAGLVAKRAAGIATKAVVASQVGQMGKDNQLLGQLAWFAMNLADRADDRHWSTLPAAFEIFKTDLPAGKYSVHLEAEDYSGQATGESADFTFEIKTRQKTFVMWRAFR